MFSNQNIPLASISNIYTLGVRITASASKGAFCFTI